MDRAERRVVVALWALQGVGVKTLSLVQARFGRQLGDLLERPTRSWIGEIRFRADVRDALLRLERLAKAADRLEALLRRLRYRAVFPDHPAWPPRLRDLNTAPPLLFMRGPGAAGPPRRRVAIVGTRHPESGAVTGVRALAGRIARTGVGIVSGAAEGIDRAAHFGALDASGETWAFLGCAIEQIDPAQQVLSRPFAEGNGTLFSEFPPGARPDPGTFARRNRLISGAADAVVVARAPKRSGALLTAAAAIRQKRPLLVVPADPWNEAGVGSNALLEQGAQVCLTERDVLKAVGLKASVSVQPPPDAPREELSDAARRVLAVMARVPQDFDLVVARVGGLSSGEIAAALLELELSGDVVQKVGKRYERVA